jgi:outer membrane protein
MKKHFLSVLLIMTIGCATSLECSAQMKIGHLNFQELMAALPETDSINKVLSDLSTEYQKLGEGLLVQYNKAYEAYSNEAATLKQAEKSLRESELLDMQRRTQTFDKESQTDYQNRYQELFGPLVQKVQSAVKEIGKENNFLYILDTSNGQVLYVPEDESYNIMPLARKKMGLT